ncbi:DUF1453 domain-containing protein [Kitasatospora sp. HPMI-4]|uniref:DUF1453 domain-containing protein n=1 Tax=Kitasatospora sp. HPMI-4 TaxID=3448443 RepID=UPI003F1C4BD8
MPALANVLIAVAAIALVISRQLRARRIDTERRFWILPVVLAVVALRDPRLVDPAHRAESAALLAASIVAVLAMGSVWGWTVRLWQEGDGSVWAKGTKATVAAWGVMIAVRLGLYGIGAALHVHQSSNALLLSLGALLLVRGVVVNWRARSLEQPHAVGV